MKTKASARIVTCIAVLLIAISASDTTGMAPESATDTKLIAFTYAVADLPVWRKSGDRTPEFAPEILMAYLRSNVDPESWKKTGEMRPFAKNASLVVSQTRANHEKIADLLASFRDQVPDTQEAEKRISR